jgi:glycosyltransferase involved in cell wall biosynthesis
MKWSILIIKKHDNGWYVNYIEQKLNSQILKHKLNKQIEVIIYEPNKKFNGQFVNVIDDNIDISNDYIIEIYNKLKKTDKDCIGFKGKIFIENKGYITFNNTSKTDTEIYYPITKFNPIRSEIIFKLKSIVYYINSENINQIVTNVDQMDNILIFMEKISNNIPVSIIVTAYKTQDYIEQCLDSIESQNYFKNNDNFEVLVGVDACEDTYKKLDEIKHKYRNLKIYMMSENKGTYITTNTLLDLANHENVIRFDSDDIMTPGLVTEVLKNKKDNDILLFGSFELKDSKVNNNFIMTEGCLFFKKSIMDNIAGGYMPWRCSADTELISRVVNRVKIGQLKKALFYRRIHSNSLTQTKETGYGSEIRQQYKKQIKDKYNKNEVKIERIVNTYNVENDIKTENRYNISKTYDTNLNNIGILVVNYNNLKYTKDCVNSLLDQINKNFTLYVVDQNSNEYGTIEYLEYLETIGVNVIKNNDNIDLNRVWNNFYVICKCEYLCFLNNDVKLTNNFTDDTINVFKLENNVGIVIHVTNNIKYTKAEHKLNYEILSPPLNQGWDFTIRRSVYNEIPEELRIFGGEDYLFSKLVKNNFQVALIYSSPIIHYKEKTRQILGSKIVDIHKNDIKNYYLEKEKNNFIIIDPTYKTNRCNKYPPYKIKLNQNKYCIYTSIIGDYDNLTTTTKHKQENWDYICYTDNYKLESDFWKVIYVNNNDSSELHNHKLARYFKTNFQNYLSSYDVILWKDSRIVINCDLNEYINLLGDNDILFMKHPDSNSILEEFSTLLSLNLENKNMINKIKKRYEEDLYNYDNGLIASGIILFKNNDRVINFFETWWNEIKNFSHRDQLSANYALFKNPELSYSLIHQNNTISENGYFLRGIRKSKRLKIF